MLTKERAQAAVRQLCTDHPDRVNPTSTDEDYGGSCLNTDPKDPDRHCLVATVLVQEGFTLPRVDELGSMGESLNASGINTLSQTYPEYRDGMTLEARDFLAHAQAAADGAYRSDEALPWSQVLLDLTEDGRL